MRAWVFMGTATLYVAGSLAFAGPVWAGDAVRSEAPMAGAIAGHRGSNTSVAAKAASTPTAANAASTPALLAEYQVRDAHGERSLVLVRSADRIEYRMQGEPVEVWRKTPDGIARLELFAKEQRSVSWSPGDLRTIGEMPQWEQLASPINPELRMRLQRHGEVKAFGGVALRYRGESAEGQAIALEWIEGDGLPSYYRTGAHKGKSGEAGAYELRLRKLERVGAEGAFTATSDYRETDYADLGDMELDPFAANYLKHRGQAHAH
ncbi:hypothetical protein [Lysobacter capsici]|uniref:hypothetical protein n=1 Tax=Lysobacter capsici TaxID=435897 RepID=UPI001C006C91|nr:hypothetical protein [Lysobacter capsici]QWF16295.1 hypothetical protein KME82_21470 [Lysobacter capsici]